MKLRVIPLNTATHERKQFNCGMDALNRYLMTLANQHDKRDHARTYVLIDSAAPSRIMGFYTLTIQAIQLTGLPSALQKKHANCYSAGLIARLAVDLEFKGQGLGEYLLIDALNKLLSASEMIGFPLIVVDAKDGAQAFYTKYGFSHFMDAEQKLFMTVQSIRMSVNE